MQASGKILSAHEISVFCRQEAMLIRSGISPSDGINTLLSDTDEKKSQNILKSIQKPLSEGESFHSSVASSGVFPSYVTDMMMIGEESGNLDIVLDSLADYYWREDNINEDIKSAITYPLIMIAMMFIVIIVLIVKVIPIMSQVFAQLGTSMNSFSSTLISIGNVLNDFSTFFVLIFAAIIILMILMFKTDRGHHFFVKTFGHIHIIRELYEDISASRFAGCMALTLSSGMDTYKSLDMIRRIVGNNAYEQKIDICKKGIEKGDSLPEAIKESGIFNSFYSRMVLVGSSSGSLDTVMNTISDYYSEAADRRINSFISILEPTLVIILSLIVGMILLSVIMPLMGIMSSIG